MPRPRISAVRTARLAMVVALTVACLLLCIPLLSSLHHAGAFFSREITMNRFVLETHSVMQLASKLGRLRRAIGSYTGFLLLLPVSLGLCVAGLSRRNPPERILFFVTCLIGIPLLLTGRDCTTSDPSRSTCRH